MGMTATGDINPLRFLVQATASDNQVTQATGTSTPIVGISGPGTRYPPWTPLDDGKHAVAGENVEVFAPPMKEAYLQLGGTVAAGDLLTSDGSGQGITASSGNQVGARAREAGTSGQSIRVQPLWGDKT